MTARKKRLLAFALGAPLAVVALAAFAHTSAGRPLLSQLARLAPGASVGCPLAMAHASPSLLESHRATSTISLRGAALTPARSRPALKWTLVATKRSDVVAWASANGVACSEELAKMVLRCKDVHEAGVSVRDLYLRFDAADALVGVDVMREGASGDAAADAFASATARVSAEAGAPTATRGEATATSLEGATYATASAEYRFRDYAADISATNFGADGIVVREQYRALD